jgi:hypothetical protein
MAPYFVEPFVVLIHIDVFIFAVLSMINIVKFVASKKKLYYYCPKDSGKILE